MQSETGHDMKDEEDILVKILKLSHSQVLAGKTYSLEEAELFLDQRLYDYRDKMVGIRAVDNIKVYRK